MAINPQIPLAAVQNQPNFAQSMGNAIQMANAFEQNRLMQEQRKDQQFIQDALKNGANFDTSEGIAAAAEQLKGSVSPKTYQMLVKAQQESQANEAEMQDFYAKASSDVIDSQNKKLDFMAQNVEEPLSAYYGALEAGKTPEEANMIFENAKAQKIQQIENMPQVGGQPLMPPNVIEQYKAGTPAQFKSKLESAKFYQANLKAALDRKKIETSIAYTEQQTRTSAAREEAIKTGKMSGAAWDDMTPEQQEMARTIATNWLVSGRQPPARGGAYQMGMMGAQQIAKEMKVTLPELLSAGAEVKSQLQARPVVEKRIQALERAENQLELEIPVMEDAMKELNLPSIPLFARGKILALREMGDPGVSKLDQAADVVFNEFETVKTGNPGALYVTNMEAAKENYYKVQTPQQMKAWIAGARRIINNAKKSNEKTRQDITDHILKSLKMKRKSGAEMKPKESTSVPRGAMPTGLPAGSKQIGHTPDGIPVWESPAGKRYVE